MYCLRKKDIKCLWRKIKGGDISKKKKEEEEEEEVKHQTAGSRGWLSSKCNSHSGGADSSKEEGKESIIRKDTPGYERYQAAKIT